MGGAGTSVPPLDELLDVEEPPPVDVDPPEVLLDEAPPDVDPPEELLDEEDELDEEEDDEEDELVLTPPVEVETPPDVLLEVELTPPVEVLTPPVDVLVEPPLVEVEPPLVVDDTTMLPPLLPPPKNPPKKPPGPPQPLLPPGTTTLPPDVLGRSSSGARASCTGACGVCTVMTVGVTRVSRCTTRRTRGAGLRTCGGRAAIGLRLTEWTWAGRAVSAIWSAPPPMIAPPQAAPHSFAKAILTDMVSHSFRS